MYKCYKCKLIIDAIFVNDDLCPSCGEKIKVMCINDNGNCSHDVVGGLKICEICGAFVCPICGCHDVTPISRVTGYYSPINAWCTGKQQELKDRTRYVV
ncbi:MAG: anaerobic ribonucleoside-triphosphate reductase [Dehalococcoidales bacterium]|jgi:hypothetical protein